MCEPTYNRQTLQAAGIRVYDWSFPDGESPPEAIVEKWLKLVTEHFAISSNVGEKKQAKQAETQQPDAIACHCVAGLGRYAPHDAHFYYLCRAPVLVALALIEFAGMSALDAISFIRAKRRGAINNKQLKYLESYQPRHRRSSRRCVIA